MSIRQIFHNLISYQFQNQHGQVRTAYLDQYFNKYKGKSDTDDYTLHKRVLFQFANTFFSRKNIKSLFHKDLLKSLFQKNMNVAINILTYYIDDVTKILNDLSESSYPHIFHQQIMDRYNRTILSLEAIQPQIQLHHIDAKNIKFEYPVEYRYQPPKPIQPYTYRNLVLTHMKGHRGFVRDYEYYHYW